MRPQGLGEADLRECGVEEAATTEVVHTPRRSCTALDNPPPDTALGVWEAKAHHGSGRTRLEPPP
jgi:hypothetical protein